MGNANVSFGYFGGSTARDAGRAFSPVSSEAVTTNENTSTATSSTAPSYSEAGGREIVARVMLNEAGWVWVGGTPVANKTDSGIKVAADTEFYVSVTAGQKVAIIDDA